MGVDSTQPAYAQNSYRASLLLPPPGVGKFMALLLATTILNKQARLCFCSSVSASVGLRENGSSQLSSLHLVRVNRGACSRHVL